MKKLINVTQADIDKSVELLTEVKGLDWAPYCPISTALRRELKLPERDRKTERAAVKTFDDSIELRFNDEDRSYDAPYYQGRTMCPTTTRARKFIKSFDKAATFDQDIGTVWIHEERPEAQNVKPFKFWLNCPDKE